MQPNYIFYEDNEDKLTINFHDKSQIQYSTYQ